MKSRRTIQREIASLKKIAQDKQVDSDLREIAFECYHAIRWVIQNTDWNPSQLIMNTNERRQRGRGEHVR